MANMCRVIQTKIESVSLTKCPHDHSLRLPTKRIQALSQWQTFLRVLPTR